jgi:IS4 transposase
MDEWKGMHRLKSSGIYVSALREEYNKYIIVITSLGKDVGTEQVLDLYRARWQIEIAFKRLKSLFRYNEMPARKTENIKTWFYGKLLLSALCETLVNTGRFSPSVGRCGRRREARP